MKPILISFLLLIFIQLSNLSFSQETDWLKCYGGTDTEYAFSITNTFNTGFIIASSTMSIDGDVSSNYGQTDCWIVKLDSVGEIQWEKTYGGTSTESTYAIQHTTDNGYIFVGATNSNNGDVSGNHGYYDCWVVKIDTVGNILWQKCFGGTNRENAYSVVECFDGGYIFAGYTLSDDGDVSVSYGSNDAWVVKLDNSGDLEWEKTFGGNQREHANVILQTSDGGFIIGGAQKVVFRNDDAWVVKMDSLGNMEWEKTYGGSMDEKINSLIQTEDEGYVFTGDTQSNDDEVSGNHGSADYWVVKINKTGDFLWQKCFGGSAGDTPEHIICTEDNGFLISGKTDSDDGDVLENYGSTDAWVIKIDSLANLEWQKCIGSFNDDRSLSSTAHNNNIFVLGSSNSNEGEFNGNHGDYDCWIKKISITLGIENYSKSNLIALYPNPTNNFLTIELKNPEPTVIEIINSNGHIVLERNISNNREQVDLSSLKSGIYFARLITIDSNESIKFIKH